MLDPLELRVTSGSEFPAMEVGIWDLDSGPVEDQQVLLASKPYFQPQYHVILWNQNSRPDVI